MPNTIKHRLYLFSDYLLILFFAFVITTFYTLGGVLSLGLILVVVGLLAAFISMAKGPDILIIMTVVSLFLVAVSFLVGGVAGLVIAVLVGIAVSTRGLVRLKTNINTLVVVVVIVAGCVAAFLFIPEFYKLIVFGAAGLVDLGLLFYSGRISPYVLQLFFTSPKQAAHILRMRVRSAWEAGTTAPESPAAEVQAPPPPETAQTKAREPLPPPPPPPSPPPPPPPATQTAVNEKISTLINRYLGLLSTLENSYRDGKINDKVYARLKDEYVRKLKDLGYEVTTS